MRNLGVCLPDVEKEVRDCLSLRESRRVGISCIGLNE